MTCNRKVARSNTMWELTKNRLAAAGVAACLLVYTGCQVGTGVHLWRMGGYLGFCLALIWFGPAIGQWRSLRINETTLGVVVIGMGWLLLLLFPLVISTLQAQKALGW